MVTASGGPGAQFSWFQGGFVRPLLITACGEISFIKMVKLGGATLLTTCWKNITPPPFGGVTVIAFSSLPAPYPSLVPSSPTTFFFLLLPLPIGAGSRELGLGAAATSLCLWGWAQHLSILWEGRHAFVVQAWTPKGQELLMECQPYPVQQVWFWSSMHIQH